MRYIKNIKPIAIFLLTLILVMGLAACGSKTEPVEESTVAPVAEQTEAGSFSMTSADGTFSNSGNIYTISSAGTYVLTGSLEGQILVDAGEEDEVILELDGVTISNSEDSPIKVISAGNVDISAQEGTENVINDTRSAKTADDETQGEGAIYADCDLKIKGKGALIVNASYNNGIHTTKDLTIQNLSLECIAVNDAVKGNDSITVTSGTILVISTNGDGFKTENTDVNKNGITRGDIIISGGSVIVYAAGDGFQAAHNFEMTTGEDGAVPTVQIYTGSNSEYTASDAETTSYKGVKVQNELNIADGSITIHSYDDGLHADYGTVFEDGSTGEGTINITGGTITLNVYSPESKTMGQGQMNEGQMGTGPMGRGQMGGEPMGQMEQGQAPGGWEGQQSVSGADGIHADNVLNISGGTINIESAYEGLEANVINIAGGTTYVSANDDGVNACSGNTTPQINVTGGYLDVTVSASGDVDGIDSNGSYQQTGGIVITRGPNSDMAAAIDADGMACVSGGTLIVLGYGWIDAEGSVGNVSLSLHSAGSHTVLIDGTAYTITNAEEYGRTICYSDSEISQ